MRWASTNMSEPTPVRPAPAWSPGSWTTPDDGVVHARLLDLVPGRSGKAHPYWLNDRGTAFTAGIKTARAGSVPRLRSQPTRRRRPAPLPGETNQPCLNAKGRKGPSQTSVVREVWYRWPRPRFFGERVKARSARSEFRNSV